MQTPLTGSASNGMRKSNAACKAGEGVEVRRTPPRSQGAGAAAAACHPAAVDFLVARCTERRPGTGTLCNPKRLVFARSARRRLDSCSPGPWAPPRPHPWRVYGSDRMRGCVHVVCVWLYVPTMYVCFSSLPVSVKLCACVCSVRACAAARQCGCLYSSVGASVLVTGLRVAMAVGMRV